MTRFSVVGVAILSVAAMASADVFMDYDAEYNYGGSGLNRFSFYVESDDGEMLSYFAELEFTGELNHLLFLGDEVMVESLANTYDGNLGYVKADDTWLKLEFEFGTQAIAESGTSFSFESGTESAVGWNKVYVAQVVSPGEVCWEGRVARNTIWYAQGPDCTPEPATLMLLALGGASFLLRRKR